jgi:hypothetical protein
MINIIRLTNKEIYKKSTKIIEEKLLKIKLNPPFQIKPPESNWEDLLSEQFLMRHGIDNDIMIAEYQRKLKIKYLKLGDILMPDVKNLYPDRKVDKSGAFYYPESGYVSWHTDSEDTCDRLYITWASEENKSFFRYYNGKEVITDLDNQGITMRQFTSNSNKPYFWHCVGSECDRISLGYRLYKK